MKINKQLMNIILSVLLLLAGINSSSSFAEAKMDRDYKHILFISSYSYDWSSVPSMLNGINDILDDSINIDYIFMDAKNRKEENASHDLINLLRERASENALDYDLVFLGDDPAVDTCLKHRKEFFADTPIVFLGVNSMEKAKKLGKERLTTGIAERMPIAETIQLAKTLYPEAKRVVAISNSTSTGKGSLEQFYSCSKDFPELPFSDINTLDYTVTELQELLSHYHDDTILLCLMYDRDKTGNKFQLEQGISWLAPHANIPIFRADELAIKSGSLGGCVISYEDMGREAAKMAHNILNGISPNNIPILEMPPYYEINWEVMQKFNIDENLLPDENLRFDNYTASFWENNQKWIQATIIIMLIANLIILILLLENKKRKRLYKKLMETNQSLDAAIELAHLAFFEYYPEEHCAVSRNSHELFVNETTLFNYPACWPDYDVTHPDDIEEYLKLFKTIDNGAACAKAEIRNRYNDTYHWYQYNMRSIYDSDGNRIKVVCLRFDITLTKEIEASYQNHLNAILTSNPNILISCHLNLTQNKISKLYAFQKNDIFDRLQSTATFHDMNNQIAESIKSDNEKELYSKTFSPQNLIQEFHKGNTSVNMSFLCTINQEPCWVKVLVEMVVEPKHGDINAIYHATNITYDKILQLMLENTTQHDYDSISFIFGKTRRYASYGMKFSSTSTIQEGFDKMIQEKFYSVNVENSEEIEKKLLWETVLEQLDKHGKYTVFLTHILENGEKRRKKVHYFYINREEKLVLGSQKDVTDIYENEIRQKETLTLALEKANKANAAKTEFLSRMSHDMRTPMNAIIGMTALALDEATDSDAVIRNLTKINSASHFLLNLINDILDMTKIEDSAIELHRELFYYDDFIDGIKTMFEPLCHQNGIELIFDYAEGGNPPPIMADQMRINQIFFNVLSNAVKYTPEGGKIIYKEEKMVTDDHYLFCDFSITDTGIGMSKDFLTRVFEPFEQEDNGITSQIQGTGLGLSITKSLIDLMKGTITIESEKGTGTKVLLCFKHELATREDILQNRNNPHEASDTILCGKKVLLVEDHPLNAEISSRLLKRKEMAIFHAQNGESAVQQFKDSAPGFFDIILMDIRMPVMDGLTATRKIRSLNRADAETIPIIAMTANAYKDDIQMALDAGMNAHLAKPIEPKRLYRTLIENL